MSAPLRPNDAAWEPEALELPLEPPRRTRLPSWHRSDDAPDRSDGSDAGPSEGKPGSHVIVIDIA